MTVAHAPIPLSSKHPSNGFGDLLRSWRRVRRLTQEALAAAAEVSQRHLSCLEAGRAQPSREMVLHLAHALDVPLRERNLLLTAAGFAAAYGHRPLDGPELAAVDQAVTLMLDGLGTCPAVAVDRDWNLVRANRAALAVFAAFVDLERVWARIGGADAAPNVFRLLFHPEGLRPAIEGFPRTGRILLERLRREVAADGAWPGGRALLAELEALAALGRTGETWAPTPEPVLTITLVKDDLRLKLFTMLATFGTAQDVTVQELRVECFFPADDRTREHLAALLDGAREGDARG
ncbi:MAG: helix-turn-helix domain-containing protein [Pseudomonadales bacterium]|jgi:transcriptional regulator with XRE-family HTH domain|nr:helix-turn-helix domain-containing protein [Pseudomonadales bacterium]